MAVFICTGNKGKLSEFEQKFNLKGESVCGIKEAEAHLGFSYKEPIEDADFFLANAFIKIFVAIQFLVENAHKDKKFCENIVKIIVDDSGLCVPAFSYFPGVHSATYGGLPRSDEKNRQKLRDAIALNPSSMIFSDGEKRLPAFFICFLFEIKFSIEKFAFIKEFSVTKASDIITDKLKNFEKKALKKIDLAKKGDSFLESLPLSFFADRLPDDIFVNVYLGYCTGEVSSREQNLIVGAGHGYDSLFYGSRNKNLSFASIPLEEKNEQSHRAFAMQAILK